MQGSGALLPKAFACTLGPSSLNERVLAELESAGAALFRINMSHTDVEKLGPILRYVRAHSKVPISIDTEGARMRTGQMTEGVAVLEGDIVRLVSAAFWGDAYLIPIIPGNAIEQLVPGARVSIDFDAAVLRVDALSDVGAEATVLVGGEIGTRKAVTALPSPTLPTFSEKDRVAARIAAEGGVREFALSFCEDASSVRELRSITGDDATIVAKIESREGVRNLDAILQEADKILIDRGDLSREVRMEGVPMLQKEIIRRANASGVPVHVATNFLESMVTHRVPTRAEVNDAMNTLLDGADGLVLSAETAAGGWPGESARVMASLIREFERSRGVGERPLEELLGDHPLAESHGTKTLVGGSPAPVDVIG